MDFSNTIKLIENDLKLKKNMQLDKLKVFLKKKTGNNFYEISNLIDEFKKIEIDSPNDTPVKQEINQEINKEIKQEINQEKMSKNKKNKKINNNETYGISAEVALCNVYNIDRATSYNGRYNQIIVDKLIPVLEKFKKDNPNIIVTESCGHTGGKVDFNATINSVENQSLSLKTLMSHDGKVCPQNVGQPSRSSWDTHFDTGFNGEKDKDKERFNYIKSNIGNYLNTMLENLYCCNYLITIINCKKTPQIILSSSKPDINFNTFQIFYTKENYECRWNESKLKFSEFSTSVKTTINDKQVTIGEIQFHKNRNCIKFRFHYNFLNSLN